MSNDDIRRREFLGAAGAAGLAALGVACGSDGQAEGGSAPDGGVEASTNPDASGDARADASAEMEKTVVAIVHADDIETAVRRAIELSGGLAPIGPGKTVFIKPNAVYGPVSGASIVTDPAVLSAVIEVVKERSPARIVVGDRSARGFASPAVFDSTGLRAAALAAGADEVYAAPTPLEAPGDWVLMKSPLFEETWSLPGGIWAMRRLLESDYVVAVPTLKNHRWAVYSLGMKLFIGAIGDASRDPLHYNLGGDPNRLCRDVAILNQIFRPLLTVIDGWTALINGGPQGQAPDSVRRSPKLVFAGRDRLAVDASAAALLKLELSRTAVARPDEAYPTWRKTAGPWDLPQLVHGVERGLGVSGPDKARLVFDAVADAAEIQRLFDISPTPPPRADGGADAGDSGG